MSTPIDFTQWSLRQLETGAQHADRSPHGPALLAELKRRQEAATGSEIQERLERQVRLLATATGTDRRDLLLRIQDTAQQALDLEVASRPAPSARPLSIA